MADVTSLQVLWQFLGEPEEEVDQKPAVLFDPLSDGPPCLVETHLKIERNVNGEEDGYGESTRAENTPEGSTSPPKAKRRLKKRRRESLPPPSRSPVKRDRRSVAQDTMAKIQAIHDEVDLLDSDEDEEDSDVQFEQSVVGEQELPDLEVPVAEVRGVFPIRFLTAIIIFVILAQFTVVNLRYRLRMTTRYRYSLSNS
jgi:hypothetical protein